ncbi:MAG: biopolymer transporter ExbD [Lentisphaeria bacterium]
MVTRTKLKNVNGKVDLVSLVDVLFLLLIFFLISSSFVFQPGIPVDLPKANVATVRAAEKIVVTVTDSETLFFNDAPVSWQELERELRELVLNSKVIMEKRIASFNNSQPYNPMLVLRADAQVPYERVIQITALARSLGLGVYMITDTVPPAVAGGEDEEIP